MNSLRDKYPLDDEMWAYLQKCQSYYPDDVINMTVSQNRQLYLQMCKAFDAPTPAEITKSDDEVAGRHGPIPVRIYQPENSPKDKVVMYLHGGGFIVGNLDSHDSICAEIAHNTGYQTVAVDYKLAPEFQHPIQFEDCMDVFMALDKGNTVIAGDSAGATLAAAICIAQKNQPQKPVGQVLIYPWLGGDALNLASYTSNHDAPGLTTSDMDIFLQYWAGDDPDKTDPSCYPLAARDFDDMPPCIAFAAEHDPIRDDVFAYVQKLKKSGVTSQYYIESGLYHGYLRARHSSEKARISFANICLAIKQLSKT